MINWTKTNGRYALGGRYKMFVQLSRRKKWLVENPEIRKIILALEKTYGSDYTRQEMRNDDGGLAFYRRVPNTEWFIDTNRRRIYVRAESNLTFALLNA